MADDFLTPWYQALASDTGICLSSDDRDSLRQRLYAARAARGDPDLDGLSLVLSPADSTHVWIVKRDATPTE